MAGALIRGASVALREPVHLQRTRHASESTNSSSFSVRASGASGKRLRRPENVEGEFFVDNSCIDCDTCRWMAPATFSARAGQSAVHQQPATEQERFKALQALLSCPTGSIRTETPPPDILQAQLTFPIPVAADGQTLPGVYHCGYHSPKSFAATSYFVVRDGGNILVDSPRFTEKLAARLESLGGVRYLFLSHVDDIADHQRWQERFQCQRIMHETEIHRDAGLAGVEIPLRGVGPWPLGPDAEVVFNPGHSSGSVSLFLKDQMALFTGDHLGSGEDGEFHVNREFNWYSVKVQIESLQNATLPLDFVWLLPGHGRRYKFDSLEHKNRVLEDMIAREEALLANKS